MIVIEKKGIILRHARKGDMSRIDELTIRCYTPIFESYVSMLGDECYDHVKADPHLTWKERKTGQVHSLFEEHPKWVWVLEKDKYIIGFVTFKLFPKFHFGLFDNNGVDPDYAGKGWGKFMYRYVLEHFRKMNLRFAHVETGLDDAHIPARNAYKAVGFDRPVPVVYYWQDLAKNNPSSKPEP